MAVFSKCYTICNMYTNFLFIFISVWKMGMPLIMKRTERSKGLEWVSLYVIQPGHAVHDVELNFDVWTHWLCVLGDIMDTMKNAAEGVKTHGSSVALWMRNSVSPTLRIMLPASPGPPQTQIPSADTANSSGSVFTERKVLHCS